MACRKEEPEISTCHDINSFLPLAALCSYVAYLGGQLDAHLVCGQAVLREAVIKVLENYKKKSIAS